MFEVVAKQMLLMGIFMALGAVLFKSELINKDGSKAITNILIYVITPAAVFRSFCIARTPEKIQVLGISVLLSALVQALSILFSHIVYKKHPLEEVALSYGNTGFFGIPVIQACLGSEAVFFIAPLVVFTGSLQHSLGVSMLLGKRSKFDWKRLLLAPNFVAFVSGLIIFFSGIGTKIPATLSKCVDLTANMSAFFAMTNMGIFLVQANLKQLYSNKDIYIISLLKLIVIPTLCAVALRYFPANNMIKMAILLACATPVGSNVANYSLLFNKDYGTASLYVSMTTFFCLFTLPLFATFAEKIIN